VNFVLFAIAAALLSLERICYILIARAPDGFRAWCAHPLVARLGTPVDVVRALFLSFKALQGAVFFAWCYVHSQGTLLPLAAPPWALATGAVLIASGQFLSTSVFYQLGYVGVFYGARLGHTVPWCTSFPFAYLSHPQYVGTVLSIWGLFLIVRFPNADWMALPLLETVYYWLGARLES
jgi:phosphatidyl-N-methylethanolamine N-methyltransferase